MKNKNEGTCGYGPGGKLGKTPGGTRGMPADKRTNDMLTLREFIREELKKITEHHEDEEFPKVGKGVGNLLDKMKGKDKALYNKVEKYIKKFIQQEIAKLKEAEVFNVEMGSKKKVTPMSFPDQKSAQEFVATNSNVKKATKID